MRCLIQKELPFPQGNTGGRGYPSNTAWSGGGLLELLSSFNPFVLFPCLPPFPFPFSRLRFVKNRKKVEIRKWGKRGGGISGSRPPLF